MRSNKKGFTLIELLIVVVIVGILALAAIPLITSNTEEARMAEGRSMLGGMRNQARAGYSRTGSIPADLAACGVTANQLIGEFYTVLNDFGAVGAFDVSVGARPPAGGNDPDLDLSFNWEDGRSEFLVDGVAE